MLPVGFLTLYSGFFLWQTYSELGPKGLLALIPFQNKVESVQFPPSSEFQVKKQLTFLSATVTRVVSRYQAEEFLILDNLPPVFLEQLNQSTIPPGWINSVANQCLALRTAQTATATQEKPLSITILSTSPVKNFPIMSQGKSLPYWQLDIVFRLSNEKLARSYRIGVSKKKLGHSQNERVFVSYAPNGTYDQKLLIRLIEVVTQAISH